VSYGFCLVNRRRRRESKPLGNVEAIPAGRDGGRSAGPHRAECCILGWGQEPQNSV